MRRVLIAAGLALGIQVATAANVDLAANETDKLSYTIGADMGANLTRQGIEISPSALLMGIKDSSAGKTLKMTDEQMKQTLQAFQEKLMAKRKAEIEVLATKNAKTGEDFLNKNKTQAGVVALPSGLQYKILEAGTGAKPAVTDTVKVDYSGKFINGNEFDRSQEPVAFKLNQVIKGWTEALQLMPAGSTWEIYIPSKLAYGERGFGQRIGPNETLIFKIKLISAQKSNDEQQPTS